MSLNIYEQNACACGRLTKFPWQESQRNLLLQGDFISFFPVDFLLLSFFRGISFISRGQIAINKSLLVLFIVIYLNLLKLLCQINDPQDRPTVTEVLYSDHYILTYWLVKQNHNKSWLWVRLWD